MFKPSKGAGGVCKWVCAPSALPSASASAPSEAGRVCMAESDRHGGCVAGEKKRENVLPELERRA